MTLAVGFLAPGRLWLLIAIVALIAVYVAFQLRRQPKYAVRFTNLALLDVVAPHRPAWRRHVTAAGFVVGAGLLVVALAEPTRAVEVPVERASIVPTHSNPMSPRVCRQRNRAENPWPDGSTFTSSIRGGIVSQSASRTAT